MDKRWMNLPRTSIVYGVGLQKFLDFAFTNSSIKGLILCPCIKCKNGICRTKEVVKEHLICDGFIKGYTQWLAHGEHEFVNTPSTETPRTINASDDMQGLLHDVFGRQNDDYPMGDPEEVTDEGHNTEAETFFKLIDDSQQELYPSCKKFSKLSFLIRMLHIKCLGNWTNKSFNMMIDLLNEAFPEGVQLPKSWYDAKKILKELGMNYEKYDACQNDCMLYWGVDDWRTECKTCHQPRWISKTEGENVAVKSLWHFPLKPRLQRLFMSSKTASLMRWHAEGRTKDGNMRHPADSPAWHTFDYDNAEFADDPRNVRLGLASDGFNPFRTMNVQHSTWPVVLMPYNLPPWMCMKKSYFMLSLLIPGPSQPGNDIDVYLQPLIAELKEMWDVGVKTYDVASKQNFQMRAALLWTISDLPANADLSGHTTKGYYACPLCHKLVSSMRLHFSKKECYMGHRCFLPNNHPYRKDSNSFDGTEEVRRAPPPLTGSMIIDELKDYAPIKFGKLVTDNPELPDGWRKQSIFFKLPYWKNNLIRHNLDVMHIEKNVCDSLLGTLLGLQGKSKDHLCAHMDLQDMGIRPSLHPREGESNKTFLPAASFTINKKEKEIFFKVLKRVKVPDGYSSNISRCVKLKPLKIYGLKSHDNHILMQQLLPLALRKVLPKSVRSPLIRLCGYFRDLCSKVLQPSRLLRMEKDIPLILCQLERIFPPSFFDIMVHLSIHLATEARIGGPVHYRWMYPIERYLSTLKSYVRNRSRPEGSIAEGYLVDECLTFCSLYLSDEVETRFNQIRRNDTVSESPKEGIDVFSVSGRPIGKMNTVRLDDKTLSQAHRYVLFNCKDIEPYVMEHKTMVNSQNPCASEHEIHRIHAETFASWLKDHVEGMQLVENDAIYTDLKLLAKGPIMVGKKFSGYIVNGFRFHTQDREKNKKTQNSGIMVSAITSSFANRRDNRPIVTELSYYGAVRGMIELDYLQGKKVVLFDCDWVSKGKRLKQDDDGFTLTNFTNVKRHNEPFILASQAKQIFYVEDPVENNWRVVLKTVARDHYDMEERSDLDMEQWGTVHSSRENEEVVLVRDDVVGTKVDMPMVNILELIQKKKESHISQRRRARPNTN